MPTLHTKSFHYEVSQTPQNILHTFTLNLLKLREYKMFGDNRTLPLLTIFN